MTQASPQRPRVPALDLLRGAAVAGMILVNTPGSWAHVYPQLDHAAWNGLHLADMVFPTFLFGVGAALGLSFPHPFARPSERWRLWRRLARRVVALVGLGLLLAGAVLVSVRLGWGFAGGDTLADLRLPGVLQRIGLCYGLAAAWAIASGRQRPDGRRALRPVALLAATAAVLAGYWLLLEWVPVPGAGAGWRTPAVSLPGYVDRMLFGVRHLWPLGSATGKGPPTFDPEGLLSTLPATANVLLGALAGWTWRAQPAGAAGRVALGGLCAALLGAAISPVDPVNKSLWSASFALLSSGGSAALLAGFAWLAGRPGPLLSPLRILGGNAILAYVLSQLFELFCGWRWLPGADGRTGLEAWAFQQLVRVLPYPELASLLCAVMVLAGITLALRPLHHRAIHFRL